MADIDEFPQSPAAAQARINPALEKGMARHALWQLFKRYKGERIRKRVFIFRVSIKVKNLRWLIEKWVGPEPTGV
jgi:hypothetical protein